MHISRLVIMLCNRIKLVWLILFGLWIPSCTDFDRMTEPKTTNNSKPEVASPTPVELKPPPIVSAQPAPLSKSAANKSTKKKRARKQHRKTHAKNARAKRDKRPQQPLAELSSTATKDSAPVPPVDTSLSASANSLAANNGKAINTNSNDTRDTAPNGVATTTDASVAKDTSNDLSNDASTGSDTLKAHSSQQIVTFGQPTTALHSLLGVKPWLEIGSHFMSNPQATNATTGESDLVTVVGLGARWQHQSSEVKAQAEGLVSYQYFTGAQTSTTRDYSEWLGHITATITRAARDDRALNYEIMAKTSRTIEPSDRTVVARLLHVDTTAHTNAALTHTASHVTASFDYNFGYRSYAAIADNYLNRLVHTPAANIAWQVNEHTKIEANAAFIATRYKPYASITAVYPSHGDTNIVPVMIGVKSDLANNLKASLKGGITFINAKLVNDEQTFVGQAEANYVWGKYLRVKAGVSKNVEATSGFSFVDVLGGYIGVSSTPIDKTNVH
ncbi:MAG: hypothetical protein JW841_03695, partial [Deltaproteobacteria bacterium]|nr:hypothetical protein [Deltaproteobacteria bacterium]